MALQACAPRLQQSARRSLGPALASEHTRLPARPVTVAPSHLAWDFGRVSVFPRNATELEPRATPAVETRKWTELYQLSAIIPIPSKEHDGPKAATASAPVRTVSREAAPGGEDLADGQTVELPVFVCSYPEDVDADSITSALTYSPSVTVSADEPKTQADFGTTWGNHVRTGPGGRIHKAPGRWEVSATYENPIVIKVYKDTGPHGQVNIESETDPDIKAGNYSQVAADLTPGTDNRPPRRKFWARDLTLVHEQFHAQDGQTFCKAAVDSEQKALNAQTASTLDEVKALLDPIPDRIIAARAKGMAPPGNEDRAYAAGAAAYKDRANKIAVQGKAGKYTAGLEQPSLTEDVGTAVADLGESSEPPIRVISET